MLSYLLVSLTSLLFRSDIYIRLVSLLVCVSYGISYLLIHSLPTQPALLLSSVLDLLVMLVVFRFVKGAYYQIGYFFCFIIKMWSTIVFQYPYLGYININYYIMSYGDTFILEAILVKIFSGTKSKSFRDYMFMACAICFIILF